uniref:Cytochrome c oxidase subunit 2 n=1 Tax=Hoplopleura akanezumi TaxID=1511645 RepID=A0A075EAQ3_9NEOP|nr:cytochrome c oxidase subunit 2 [Hoplopleura akanezumi]
MSVWSQLSLHNGCSSTMLHIEEVYDWVMVMVTFIVVMISVLMFSISLSVSSNLNYSSNELLEFVWVVIPSLILFALAIPSLHCLYLMEEVYSPAVTVKVIGHQWYWSYEYGDFEGISYDSYLSSKNSPVNRLLEVDNEVCIPLLTEVRFLVSSADVLHSWALPALGVKVDAIPGRINQVSVYPKKVGVFYGQCSEMCGTMHSFMPIHVSVMPFSAYLSWSKLLLKFN